MPEHPKGSAGISQPVQHATTTGMTGGGFYNANSAPQWKAIEMVLPWLTDATADIPLKGTGTLTLADFGCSEGRNSIAVMDHVLGSLLPRTERPVQTMHSDLPTNDFSKLFLNLRPDGKPVYPDGRVFSAAVGGSMYDQLLPPGSVSLATTFNAIGFLSRRPVGKLPGFILPNGPSRVRANGFVSPEDQRAFAEQAKQDVADFLKARAKELVPGGKLLVEVFGTKGEVRTCDGLYDLLNDALLDFVESGDVSKDVYENYYQPAYMRTLPELTGPVTGNTFGSAGLFSLDRALDYEISVPFNERYENDGDLARYATDYVNFFRAFTGAVLENALPGGPEKKQLLDRIYSRAEELLMAAPERYPFRYAAVAMLLTRTD